jgi:hypothetical protein
MRLAASLATRLRQLGKAVAAIGCVGAALLLGLLLHLWRAEAPVAFDAQAAAGISYTPLLAVVPGPAAPDGVGPMASNNNVDLAQFEGRAYMAYRTAPTHFASEETRLVVVSSSDRKAWDLELSFGLEKSDLREPRFLVFQGKLFLYFFRGGSNPLNFEPQSIYVRERDATGAWGEARAIFRPGYVVWRAKARGDVAYMSVYHGAGLYTTGARPGEIRLLRSRDGITWEPISEAPQCIADGAEEAEFEFDEAGNLVATIRLEVQGAMVCRASKDDLAAWETHYTPDKYDSALMFRRGEDFYVVARRNVAGAFHRGWDFLPQPLQRAGYLARYSLTRKRTALYKVDLSANTLVPLLDFPSQGDTAFPALIPIDARSYYLVNYSCPLEGSDWPWLAGQLIRTNLYETTLTFPPPPPALR